MSQEPLKRTLSGLTCPECRGPLWKERRGRIVEYRCRVGHAYSPLSMAEEHRQTLERTLWSVLVTLEEAAEINKTLNAEPGGDFIAEHNIQEKIETIKGMLDDSPGIT